MVPTTKNSAPSPLSQGKNEGAPVEASDAVIDTGAAPEFPVVPSDAPPDVDVDVATGVTPADVVVVVPVVPVGLVVVVVPEPAAAAVNVTVTGEAVRSTLSDVSWAVYLTASAVESLTVNVAIPLLSDVAFVAVTFDDPPDPVRDTVLPVTGLPLAS